MKLIGWPMNKYDVILADPPWKYDGHLPHIPGKTRVAESYYDTMPTQEIAALPIGDLAADNAVLFLWITWPMLYHSRVILDGWGFEYKTIAWVWIKANQNGFGFFTGMGSYTRANSEPCLLAFKGQMPEVANHGIQSLIYSAVRAHSKKPEDQFRKIEALYPGTRRIELFARRPWPGWDAWGNEIPNSIDIEGTNG